MSFGRRISANESIQNLPKANSGSPPEKGEHPDLAEPVVAGLDSRFEPRLPRCRMEDLILPEAVLSEIRMLKSRIRNHELIYRDWGFDAVDSKGINVAVSFYGPPGTGKTMCAEALAADLGRPIIEINYAEIE